MILHKQIKILNTDALYDAMCYDGFAVASDGKQTILLSYPKINQITGEDISLIAELREIPNRSIDYGDIMLTFGTITRIIQS
jgi:hypothetical protein